MDKLNINKHQNFKNLINIPYLTSTLIAKNYFLSPEERVIYYVAAKIIKNPNKQQILQQHQLNFMFSKNNCTRNTIEPEFDV